MKIFWALDPFSDQAIIKAGGSLARRLKTSRDSLQVVYVATLLESKLSTAYDVPEHEILTTYPKMLLENALAKIQFKPTGITVLDLPTYSVSSAVAHLSVYLKKMKAGLVVTSSRSQTGFHRFLTGSFAETLIHLATCDVLVFKVSTKINPAKQPRLILYAHDFTKKGDKGLDSIMAYAKKWRSKIQVLYQPPLTYSIEFEGQDKKVQRERKRIDTKAIQIQETLKKNHIRGTVVIKQTWLSASECILRTADKENVDMIAVTSQTSHLMAAIGGSITRQTVRGAKVPTLILKV